MYSSLTQDKECNVPNCDVKENLVECIIPDMDDESIYYCKEHYLKYQHEVQPLNFCPTCQTFMPFCGDVCENCQLTQEQSDELINDERSKA